MRLAIMAAGGVGGYFGARLAEAGNDVLFIARGAHLQSMRENGLKIVSPLGDAHLTDPNVTDDTSEIGPVDAILFAVKLWDTEEAGKLIRPLVGSDTRVITLQNGIDSVERLQPILGEDAVVGGLAYISALISEPGVITHTGQFARIVCGRSEGKPDEKLAAFVKAAKAAKINIDLSDDIDREIWEKFVFLVAFSGATASMRSPIGPIREDPDTRKFFRNLMEECVAVARARGITIADDFVAERMKFADSTPAKFKASMFHDLETGHRLELDWLAGKVAELGRELDIPTPANEAVYAILKLHRMGRRA
jgi:2-dehydropantoate 2-reductase